MNDLEDSSAYYFLINEGALDALRYRYSVEDVEYIFSSGVKLLKDFQIKEDDENILTAFLLYFSSIRSKVDDVIDLRQAKDLSDLETASILKDLLMKQETTKTAPIMMTIHNDERLKSYLNNRSVNFISR